MAEIFNFIVNFVITYFMLKLALMFFHANQESKELQRQEFKQYLDKIVHSVKEEVHGDQIYWFDKDKDVFITQGKNKAEIVDNLKKHFQHHIFIIDDSYILCGPDWEPSLDKAINIKTVDK